MPTLQQLEASLSGSKPTPKKKAAPKKAPKKAAPKATSGGLTAAELGAANAAGMTPGEFKAAYTTPRAQTEAAGSKPKPVKKKPKPAPSTTTSAATAPANPFEQLAQGLVSQLQAEQAPVEQAVSGADTAPATSNAVNQALADAGLSPGSSAGQWLNANVAQANQNDQPMAQAMQAYGQAYTQGQGKVDTALTQLGQSSDLGVQSAPEQTWLTDLASHIQSNLAYYGQIPSGSAETLPPAILYYLQQSGTGGAGNSGTKQLSQLTVPGEHTAASAVPSISSAAPGSTITPSLTDTAGGAPS